MSVVACSPRPDAASCTAGRAWQRRRWQSSSATEALLPAPTMQVRVAKSWPYYQRLPRRCVWPSRGLTTSAYHAGACGQVKALLLAPTMQLRLAIHRTFYVRWVRSEYDLTDIMIITMTFILRVILRLDDRPYKQTLFVSV